jgi:maleate isomerase
MDNEHTARVALIVPASNTVMEPDFARAGGPAFEVTVWRIQLDSVTREAEERMLDEELPARLDKIAPTEPDLVVFGCTSAGALGGLGHDAAIARRIHEATGADVVTVVGAMVEHLDAVDRTQVAVFTPYTGELTRAVATCVTESGYRVPIAKGMGLVDNDEIGEVAPHEIVSFVSKHMQGLDPDAVFLSCTNWRAVEAIEPLREALDLPVLTSNQVTLDSVRSRLAATKP